MDTYPILEYDRDPSAVLRPEMMIGDIGAPEGCVLCFFPKAIEQILSEYPHRQIAAIVSEGVDLPVWAVEMGGSTLGLVQARIGGPGAASQMEELYVMGCRRFLACGSCGVLREDLAAGHLIVPSAAVRDEGTSYHYMEPSREVELDKAAVACIEEVLSEAGVPFLTAKTWTTDAVYRETRARVDRRKREGCVTVEMECASWAAVARYLGAGFGQILYAGDTLGGEEWDGRDFFTLDNVREQVLRLALRACLKMI